MSYWREFLLLHNDFNTLGVLGAVPPPTGSSLCDNPDSPLVAVACAPSTVFGWLSAAAWTAWAWITVSWPQVAALAVVALIVGALLAVVVGRRRRDAADAAQWVEIVPPADMPSDGAHALWRALAGMLHRRTPMRGLGPRRLTMEFVGDEHGVRAGLWVPPTWSHRRVADLVGQAWPGARVRATTPPRWCATVHGTRVSTVEVFPSDGPWTPLLDPGPRMPRPVTTDQTDPLRGVFATLAACGQGQTASVQLVVTALRGTRGRQQRPWWARVLLWLLLAVPRGLLAIWDFFQTDHTANTPAVRPVRGGEPVSEQDAAEQARRKDITAKQGRPPHLRVTLRVVAAAPGPRRDRLDTVDAVVDGLASAAPLTTLATHTVHSTTRADQRRPSRRGFAATVAELAALWHLPGDPVQYGMRVAPARTRDPGRDIPRLKFVTEDLALEWEDNDDDIGDDDGFGDGRAA